MRRRKAAHHQWGSNNFSEVFLPSNRLSEWKVKGFSGGNAPTRRRRQKRSLGGGGRNAGKATPGQQVVRYLSVQISLF